MTTIFVPVENTVQCNLIGSIAGQEIHNILYFKYDAGDPDVTEMTNLAAFLYNWWDSNIKPLLSNDYLLNMIKVVDLTTQTSPGVEYTTLLPVAGSVNVDAVTNSVAITAKFTTGYRGRSFRGRNFITGFPTSALANQVACTVPNATAFKDAYDELLASPLSGWKWVVVSRISGGSPRSTGIATPVVMVTVSTTLQSQRRRLLGRGN